MEIERFSNWCLASHGHDMIKSNTGLWVRYSDHVAELAAVQADARRLKAMMPLFEEARDALTAIPLVSAKLHGLRLDLADRMDQVGIAENWKALDALNAGTASQPTELAFEAFCPDGQKCGAVTTGCRTGQCQRKKAQAWDDVDTYGPSG